MPIELPPGTAAYSDRNPPPRNRQWLTLLLLFVAVLYLVVWGVGAIANQIVWWIPPAVEQQLGRVMVPLFAQQSKASPTQTALNRLLDRLETHLPKDLHHQRDFQLLYIPEATVNAIALPGDTIVVYQGLLKQVQSENELMMVLGHELGHFAHRDHLRGLGQALLWQIVLGMMLGDPGSLGAIAGAGVANLSTAQFSQQQEQQADTFGLTLLYQTYGHVGGATDFFVRLQKEKGRSINWLASHPAPEQRVQTLKALIQQQRYPIHPVTPLSDQAILNPL
ncbi:MAG: M48 family metallopeptidase [Thermosynechococcaceae cyanobacterium]